MTPSERLAHALVDAYPADAARVLEQLDVAAATALLDELEPDAGGAVVARLDAAFAAAALAALDPDVAATLIAGQPPAAAAVVLRRIPSDALDAILAACPPGFATRARAVLAAPSRTAGAIMDPQAPSLPRDLTAAAACAVIRERPDRFKHYVYVVDRAGVLVGVTRVIDLIAAGPDVVLEDVMRRSVTRVGVDEVEVAVVAHPGWARFRSLPVVDSGERLVGVIRDDVVEPLQRARAAHAVAPVSLAVSLAELFWLGMTGVTEGFAAVVGREAATQAKAAHEAREADEP